MLTIGSPAPRFDARTQDGRIVRLDDFIGRKNVVLFFFSRQGHPAERGGSRVPRTFQEFEQNDAVIFGVSPDSADADVAFRLTEGLPFDLLPDPDFELCRLYGVKVTNLLVFKLVERVTFVVGKDGLITEIVRDTKPGGHASEALRWL